ncbi:AAA-like domain-containing protein [Calothrix sp. CCY 0018]|uniref:AAA-like domain-containing protein n=1 Tax=Calothrix sp. CCY 0018 TaxID=3103864 RepID=UPI0039C6535C
MGRSVTLRRDRQAQVLQRINGEFYSQQNFAENLMVSASTVSNFVNCRPVDRTKFIDMCGKLGIENWCEYAAPPNQSNSNNHRSEELVQSIPNQTSIPESESFTPEYPEGQIQVGSPFYIERPPIEERCYEEITRAGALIRIKAPKRMGKSSLLARILHQAEQQGDRTVYLSLESATKDCFKNTETFLKWFCASVARALDLSHNLDEYWELAGVIGGNLCCQEYFEKYLLTEIDKPITLGLDDVDKVFEHPDIYPDFLGLLRVLHEEAKQRPIWKRLRLVIAHSTEVYVPINLNQSPFNVGLPVALLELTLEQILWGANNYQLNWSETEVLELMGMVGGHPYLVGLALYHIARKDLSLKELLETAPTTTGIYSTYLRRIESILEEHPELKAGMEELISNAQQAQLSNKTCSKLNALGLIKVENGRTLATCGLYRQYFFG